MKTKKRLKKAAKRPLPENTYTIILRFNTARKIPKAALGYVAGCALAQLETLTEDYGIEYWNGDFDTEVEIAKVPCNACEGTSYTDSGEACSHCEGTGEVEAE